MTSIQILGILSLLLAVVASVLCAARLGNWRHPILFVAMMAIGLLPGSIVRPQEQPIQRTKHDEIGQLVQTYYQRIRDEQANTP